MHVHVNLRLPTDILDDLIAKAGRCPHHPNLPVGHQIIVPDFSQDPEIDVAGVIDLVEAEPRSSYAWNGETWMPAYGDPSTVH